MCLSLRGRGAGRGAAAVLLPAIHSEGEARAQSVRAKNRKQVDSAEAQMGVGQEEAHAWASGGTWWNGKASLLSSQAGESRGPQLGFRLL